MCWNVNIKLKSEKRNKKENLLQTVRSKGRNLTSLQILWQYVAFLSNVCDIY